VQLRAVNCWRVFKDSARKRACQENRAGTLAKKIRAAQIRIRDLFIFGGWFVFHMVYRAWDPATFFVSPAQLNQTMGMVNTIILQISSWLVALCVNAARTHRF
jgi:heme/copper-type cytochrome/quinol oxidase subunit 3